MFESLRSQPNAKVAALIEESSRDGIAVAFPQAPQPETYLVAGPLFLSLVADGALVWEEPWCVVQQITWASDSQSLTIEWSNPGREQVVLKRPELRFLQRFGDFARQWLGATQVANVSEKTARGTAVRASVRRAPDASLYSEVVAYGPTEPADEELFDRLERQVREMAGLD